MRRVALVLLATLTACGTTPDSYRETVLPREVVLGGWSIPDGATVCGETKVDGRTAFWFLADTDFERRSLGVLRGCTRGFEVDGDGDVVRAVMTNDHWDVTDEYWQDGERYAVEKDIYELLGEPVLHERTDLGWDLSLVSGSPTPEQAKLLSLTRSMELEGPEYPSHPVAVGDVWEVPRDLIAQRFGRLAPGMPARYRLRLDSLSVNDSIIFAHVSGTVSVTRDSDTGRDEMTASIRRVRRLDVLLDVASELAITTRAWRGVEEATTTAGYTSRSRYVTTRRIEAEAP